MTEFFSIELIFEFNSVTVIEKGLGYLRVFSVLCLITLSQLVGSLLFKFALFNAFYFIVP